MEQRQDYLESQINTIADVLKKILEKLLKLKTNDSSNDEMQILIASMITENLEGITIDGLKMIKDTELVNLLIEEFDYNDENLKQLANILFELWRKEKTKLYLKQKAVILYKYLVLDKKNNLDFLIFSRIKDLETSLY